MPLRPSTCTDTSDDRPPKNAAETQNLLKRKRVKFFNYLVLYMHSQTCICTTRRPTIWPRDHASSGHTFCKLNTRILGTLGGIRSVRYRYLMDFRAAVATNTVAAEDVAPPRGTNRSMVAKTSVACRRAVHVSVHREQHAHGHALVYVHMSMSMCACAASVTCMLMRRVRAGARVRVHAHVRERLCAVRGSEARTSLRKTKSNTKELCQSADRSTAHRLAALSRSASQASMRFCLEKLHEACSGSWVEPCV